MPENIDWDFQRDVDQLKQAIDATDAMLTKVMNQVQDRSARAAPRNEDDALVISQVLLAADQVKKQFALARAGLDPLLGFLTADESPADDLPEDPS